jgi:hypothetical protein
MDSFFLFFCGIFLTGFVCFKQKMKCQDFELIYKAYFFQLKVNLGGALRNFSQKTSRINISVYNIDFFLER